MQQSFSFQARSGNWAFAGMRLAGLLVACSGCWEEIHYIPSAKPTPTGAKADTSAVEEPSSSEPPEALAADSAPAVETPAPAEAPAVVPEPAASTADTQTPSPDELFGADSQPSEPPIPTVAVSNDPAEPATDETNTESVLPTPEGSTVEAGTLSDTADAVAVEPLTPERQRLVWQAASKWSLAAGIYAKRLPAERYQPILDEANAAAAELGLELPPLPAPDRPEDLEAVVIDSLRGESAVALVNGVAKVADSEAGSAADLAIRSHLLLLTYSPKSADAGLLAESLRQVAEGSGLPAELWGELVKLVEARAPFSEVRQAVFDLHRRAGK